MPRSFPLDLAVRLGLAALALLLLLAGVPVLALAARIGPVEAFRVPARVAVYEEIRGRPGATAAELAPRTGLAAKTVTHHARVLAHLRLLEAERDGRRVRYFLPGARRPVDVLAGPARDLVALALARPGVTQIEAARALGVSRATIQWHARRLAAKGLLEASRLAVPREARAAVAAAGPTSASAR